MQEKCQKKVQNSKNYTPHHKLYRRWKNIIHRCTNPKATSYENYGGKGITVCYEWSRENPKGFENFEKWMYSQGYNPDAPFRDQTIDRIDNNKGYNPDNCRLISNFEQQANTKKNVFITINGETHHISEWSRITGLSKVCITRRLKRFGESPRIFTEPLKKTSNRYRFLINGKEYIGLNEISHDFNIPLATLSNRLNKGFDIEEAISKPIRGHKE